MIRHLLIVGTVAALIGAGVAWGEPEYTVQDLGPVGFANQPWSISQNGLVVGYSDLGDHDEGFFADGEEYKFIGSPGGTSRTDLLGVNILGHAAGKSGTVHENGRAILWMDDNSPDGRTESLGTLGGSRSAGKSINDLDQLVGWSKLEGDAESRPFLWEDDVMTPLPLLGGTQGSADWINNAGQIVGSSTTDTDGLQQFAVFWEGGDPVRLPPEHAGLNNIAYYIHDNGDIAGSMRLPREGGGFLTRAVLWHDLEVFLELGTLADGTPVEPYAASWASAVNASGVVVGMSVNEESALVPFVYRNGEMTQLSGLLPAGWELNFVGSGALNDAGQIVVSGFRVGEGGSRALLLTPTIPASVGPATPEVALRAGPNPFRGGIAFQLLGTWTDAAPIVVIDVSGRRVRELPVSASGFVWWDGTETEGRPVAPGAYFARGSGMRRSLRLLRVR